MPQGTLGPAGNRLLASLPRRSWSASCLTWDTSPSLQARGLISYVRGRITNLDRRGLETSVCECYKMVKDEYARLLG